MMNFARAFGSVFFGVLASLPVAAAEPPEIVPDVVLPAIAVWDSDGIEDFSGVACGAERDGRRNCVIVDDEQRRLGFVTFAGGKIELKKEMAVLDKETKDAAGATIINKEADLEAVSRDGNDYWVFGSHGTKREPELGQTDCPLQPDRRHLYHFTVDPNTDLPAFAFDRKIAASEIRRIDRLPAILATIPSLVDVVDAKVCGNAGGFTIEGGAVSGGRMMVGIRSPLFDGRETALIVEIGDTAALVAGTYVEAIPHYIALGKDMGVRDLAAVAGGHLILAGPSGSDDKGTQPKSTIWFWPKGEEVATPLAALGGVPAGAKPEGMAVLAEDAAGWRVLILNDNVKGGAPLEYRIARR